LIASTTVISNLASLSGRSMGDGGPATETWWRWRLGFLVVWRWRWWRGSMLLAQIL